MSMGAAIILLMGIENWRCSNTMSVRYCSLSDEYVVACLLKQMYAYYCLEVLPAYTNRSAQHSLVTLYSHHLLHIISTVIFVDGAQGAVWSPSRDECMRMYACIFYLPPDLRSVRGRSSASDPLDRVDTMMMAPPDFHLTVLH